MALEDDVKMLMDHKAITELLYLYNVLVDSQQYDRLGKEVYAENGSDHHGVSKVEGREAVAQWFAENTSNLAATAHAISNLFIEIDGDTATAKSNVTSWAWTKATAAKSATEPADYCLWVGYDDDIVRTPEGWRILNRRVVWNGASMVAAGIVPASQKHVHVPATAAK